MQNRTQKITVKMKNEYLRILNRYITYIHKLENLKITRITPNF